ncbi:MAG: hypothetical protein WBM13_07705, partial [Bacteroidia bacterium]
MKNKIKLILLLMISTTHFINAQSSWWHTAGELRTGVASGNTGSLLFYNSGNANSVKIQSGATSATHTLTLPTTQGAANTVLMNNGSGTLTWQNAGGIGAWSLIGNAGTTAGTNFIGTTDAVDWVVKTNSNERIRVLSGGNVGIGTTTPGKILDVVGPDNADAQFRLYKGANIVSTLGTGTGAVGAESGVLQLYNNSGATGVQIFSEGDSWITGGNLGIGTATPGKILDVVGPDNAGAQFRLYKGANIVSMLGTGTSTAGAESGVLQLYNDAGAIGVQIFSQGNSWITGSNVG